MVEAITWALLALSVSVLLAARRITTAILAAQAPTAAQYVNRLDDVTVIAWAMRLVYATLALLAVLSLVSASS